MEHIFATAAFLYCGDLLLPYQLLILGLACVIGCIFFLILDYKCVQHAEYEVLQANPANNKQFHEELEEPLLQTDP